MQPKAHSSFISHGVSKNKAKRNKKKQKIIYCLLLPVFLVFQNLTNLKILFLRIMQYLKNRKGFFKAQIMDKKNEFFQVKNEGGAN